MNPPPLNPSVPINSRAAVSSLVCGICAVILGPFTGIPAIITGHIALSHIKKSGGLLGGQGMAVAGLVMGYVFTFVTSLVMLVLASAGFAAGSAAIHKARKVQALATCTAIESAVNNYYAEYGEMPLNLGEDPASALNTKKDIGFLNVLLGLKETGDKPMNPRAIKFLSVREASKGQNGMIYSPDGTQAGGLVDPWGGAYHVMLDCNYDEEVKVNPSAGGGTTLHGTRVAVWSDGADGVKGGGKQSDDVKTW